MPETAGTSEIQSAKVSGWRAHKNPNCPCIPCSRTRNRAQKALNGPAGDGGDELDLATRREIRKKRALTQQLPTFVSKTTQASRMHVANWVALRSTEPGITTVEIAKRLGLSANWLRTLLTRAHREGWLTFEDPMLDIEHGIIPKVIDNLNHFLDAKDRLVTIETAKNTIYKEYVASRGVSDAPQTILAIKIEPADAPASSAPVVISGEIIGKPRSVEE